MSDSIKSSRAPVPLGAYPHARRCGSLLFLSGIGPRPPSGGTAAGVKLDANGEVLEYDIEAQVHAVCANVRSVLEDAGANWSDLVDITVFLTDIRRDFAAYNKVYASYFDGDGPTRTTIEVSRLPGPIAIEMKCIAALRD
ncbi:RidA family protein [Woeseia oceani]|uniref:2-aminomuconate deaminase n=1 Tax=Woeseia oceani TaxID=1548547 RepID=A0A193LHT4_9GAMM|nr:Rid family hydrolase [Woeseia oceani]ANO51944.1 2-aminomuconate deaminase [Woeseia oceani]